MDYYACTLISSFLRNPISTFKHTLTVEVEHCATFKYLGSTINQSGNIIIDHIDRGYFRSIWTAVYQFWAHPILAPKLGKPVQKIFCESKHGYFV